MSTSKIHPGQGVEVSHLSQSFKAGTWKPSASRLMDIAKIRGAQDTKERLINIWTTLGLVSALLLTMTYPAVIDPPIGRYMDNEEANDDPLVQAYILLNVASFILSLSIIVTVLIFISEIAHCVDDEHLTLWIQKFALAHNLVEFAFSASIFVIGAQVMVLMWYNNKSSIAIATYVMWAVAIPFVGFIGGATAVFNRKELTKRGKALAAKASEGGTEEAADS